MNINQHMNFQVHLPLRSVTRNFSVQGRFLKIRALRQILNQQYTKERPSREKFGRFFSYIRLKQHFKREMKPVDEPSQGIFSQNQDTFLQILKKGWGNLPPLPTPLSQSNAPASNSYLPYIIQPSRYRSLSRILIDNIFSNVISRDIICGNITATICGHLPQILVSRNTFANPPSNKLMFLKETGQNFARKILSWITLIQIGVIF